MSSFSASQIACLHGLELPLWKLNPDSQQLDVVESTSVENTSAQNARGDSKSVRPSLPEFVDPSQDNSLAATEIRLLLDWCKNAGDRSSALLWRINPALTESTITENQLHTPPLSMLMATPSLKRQLWQLLCRQP